jgi:hypothetical protein
MSDCGQCVLLYEWLLNSRFVAVKLTRMLTVNAFGKCVCRSVLLCVRCFGLLICLLLGCKCSTVVRDEQALLLSF